MRLLAFYVKMVVMEKLATLCADRNLIRHVGIVGTTHIVRTARLPSHLFFSFPPVSKPIPAMDFSNPALVAAIQGKLQSLIGRDSGYIKSLPKEVKRRVNALKNLQVSEPFGAKIRCIVALLTLLDRQSKQAELESKLQEEILALERKYHVSVPIPLVPLFDS